MVLNIYNDNVLQRRDKLFARMLYGEFSTFMFCLWCYNFLEGQKQGPLLTENIAAAFGFLPRKYLAMRRCKNNHHLFCGASSHITLFSPFEPYLALFQLIKDLIPSVNSANLFLYHTSTSPNEQLSCFMDIFCVLS